MPQEFSMKTIARIRSDFAGKFGVPRQSGLVEALEARVVFEPEYRNPAALRGLEGFSHIWLVWVFDQAVRAEWSPTVRPPRLGGNARLGVFATRSPFRPNPIGLSCVKLTGVELSTPDGPLLHVSGADLMDGTPIFDIKPYIPYADCRPEAAGGFAVDRLGARKASAGSLGLAAALYLVSALPLPGTLAVFLFNMTMPVTLWAAARAVPGAKGFSFGLLTFALFLGALPSFLGWPSLLAGPGSYAAMAALSLVLLWFPLRKEVAEC